MTADDEDGRVVGRLDVLQSDSVRDGLLNLVVSLELLADRVVLERLSRSRVERRL